MTKDFGLICILFFSRRKSDIVIHIETAPKGLKINLCTELYTISTVLTAFFDAKRMIRYEYMFCEICIKDRAPLGTGLSVR